MRILFIKPKLKRSPAYNKKLSTKLDVYPELTIPQLAGITTNEHNVKAIFERYHNINFNWDGDLVGVSCVTPLAPRAYEIADKFRKRGVKVVLGGWHPTALPEEAKQHADSVVIGEAEDIWPKLLKDLEKGQLKPFYRNKKPVDLEFIPNANRGVNEGFCFMAGVQATRGCPMGCDFCGVTSSPYGHIFRKRPIENVIEEIENIKHKYLYFYDPSLTINPTYTKRLFKAMQCLDKKFTCFGNINVLKKDEELLKVARDAGCQNWYIGFESISQETIDRLGKKSNRVENYIPAVKKIHEYGMSIIGSFVFGFDTDGPDIFKRTVDMIYDLEIDIVEFTILTPYPGTPLFERLEKEKRILIKDWSKYTERGNVVFEPKRMTAEELLNGTEWANNEINTLSGLLRRIFNSKNFTFHNFVSNIIQFS